MNTPSRSLANPRPAAHIRWLVAGLEILPQLLIRPPIWVGTQFLRVLARLLPGRRPVLTNTMDIEEQVEAILGCMSLREKTRQMHGLGQMRAPTNWRLGIPSFKTTDGPRGIGEAVWRFLYRHVDRATAFPTAINVAATWDVELCERGATAIATEARSKGRNWLLAPAVDVTRDPRAGRTQESYGEDPLVNARFGVAFVKGTHRAGLAACAKHFACRHQEFPDRDHNVRISERALRERYLRPFEACVEAGVDGVMATHNRIHGDYGCENRPMLTGILKEEWGFDGVAMSDWKDVLDTRRSIEAGLDLEMPKGLFFGKALIQEVKDGTIDEHLVDEATRRLLRVKLRRGILTVKRRAAGTTRPHVHAHQKAPRVNGQRHQDLSEEIARKSIILLKNKDKLLPFSQGDLDSIAVIGPSATVARLGDGGSSDVRPFFTVSPVQGLKSRVRPVVEIRTAKGCDLKEGSESLLAEAVALARRSDRAVLCVGLSAEIEGEGLDRVGNDLELPAAQIELIEAVIAVQPRTVVVTFGGSAISMQGWAENVPAILHAGYPGESGGAALADLLLGNASPSGKLPLTFPATVDQLPTWPHFNQRLEDHYPEGIFVGYRHFDRQGLEPLFPFGHGLSYTRFIYEDLQVSVAGKGQDLAISIQFWLCNMGRRSGAEVAQVYVHDDHAKVDRPDQELAAFGRAELEPGDRRRMNLRIGFRELAYWDTKGAAWRVDPGNFELRIGASSKDIRMRHTLEITQSQLS